MKLASAIYRDCYPFDALLPVKQFFAVRDPNELEEGVDVLVVWGGEDISPALYNHPVHGMTGARGVPSERDRIEWNLMKRAVELDIPIIGVCRGAQMLCALAGGALYQHVDNHTCGEHQAETVDGTIIPVSSLHHQMMNPNGTNHELLAWSQKIRSQRHLGFDEHGEGDFEVSHEPEYIYFPDVRGHAIQWHPEFEADDSQANLWLKSRWQRLGL